MTSNWNPTAVWSHMVVLGYDVNTNSNNGLLYVFGANSSGQLGNADGTGKMQMYPLVNPFVSHVIAAAAGGSHTLAVTSSGAVYAWGNNYFGELGNNSTLLSIIPYPVVAWPSTPAPTIISVAAGGFHSLALDTSGKVYAWGDGGNGQLGNNSKSLSITPTPVLDSSLTPLTNAISISAGGSHNLAIVGSTATAHSGTAYAWGYGAAGQLGQSDTGDRVYAVPVFRNVSGNKLHQLTNVKDIAAGGSHSLFLVDDGVNPSTIYACGYNSLGQIGDGTTNNAASGAIKITLPAVAAGKVLQVAAGLDHSLALVDDGTGNNKGTVWAWGYNYFGQLGDLLPLGSIFGLSTPAQVVTVTRQPLQNIKKIFAIGNFSFAIDADGHIWAWGDNTFGQLGTGDIFNRNYATQITLLGNWGDIYHPMP